MNRREVKRIVAARLAVYAFQLGEEPAENPAARNVSGDDLDRFREAAYEFSEELYRRAGLDREARKVDERQLSIYDALYDAELEGMS